jgi:ferredoxin
MSDITINVQNDDNSITALQAPTDMGLSLMEFLKGNDYDILATCGGMALCATCHVEVLKGYENLPEIGDDEYAMLDTLPNITATSRLSCQLRLTPEINGIAVKVMGDGLS